MAEPNSSRSSVFGYMLQVLQETGKTLREEHLLDAVYARFSAAIRNGLALYLLALLALSVALIAGRSIILEFTEYHAALREELGSTLQGRHEASRDDKYFGVVAVLLREVNGTGAQVGFEPCPGMLGCLRMEVFLRTFQRLALTALEPEVASVPGAVGPGLPDVVHGDRWKPPDRDSLHAEQANRAVGELRRELRRELSGTLPDEESEAWNKQAARNLQAYWGREKHLPLEPCRRQRSSMAPLQDNHDDDFGPKLCEQDGWASSRTQLLVPSLENLGSPVPSGHAVSVEGIHLKRRLQRAYWLSRLLDDALAAVVPRNCAFSSSEDYAFVQAYFISPDSLIRLWQCKAEGKVSSELFGNTRLWTSANYFQQLLQSGSDFFDTAAYIDYGGFGLVRTRCVRVVGRQAGEAHLQGIACADYTVPLRSFSKTLVSSRLLEVEHVRATLTGESRFTTASVKLGPLSEQGTATEVRSEDDPWLHGLVQGFNQALDKEFTQRGHRDDAMIRALGQQVIPLRIVPDTSSFFVPLGGTHGQGFEGLLITPRIHYPDIWGALLVMLSSLGTSGLLAAMGQTRARREGETQTVTDLLRNLEVGVLIVDEHERVEAANDRAEDVLGVLLPKMGRLQLDQGLRPKSQQGDEGVQLSFMELIERSIIRVDERGRPRGRMEVYEDIIPEQRRNNDSSTYYGKLRMGLYAGRWIRITASPISLRRGRPTQPRTFGLVAQVRPKGRMNAALRAIEKNWEKTRRPLDAKVVSAYLDGTKKKNKPKPARPSPPPK